MSGLNVTDMLALADAINGRMKTDERLTELIQEISTALADILAAMEKPEDKKDEQAEADALGKAIAAAVLLGLKNMPAPILKMDMPAAPAAAPWKTLSVKTPKGESYVITRN